MSASTQSTSNPRLQKRIFLIFMGTSAFFVVLALVILPVKLYTRDVTEARTQAREVSELIRVGLLSTMTSTGEPELIRQLIQDLQKHSEFQFRMIRSLHVEAQHGSRIDEQFADDTIKEVLETGKHREDWLDRTTFRYVAPFVADSRCQDCHESVTGEEIRVGEILGVSEIVFDLANKEAESVRLIVEVLFLLAGSLFAVSFIFYFVVKKGILETQILTPRKDI